MFEIDVKKNLNQSKKIRKYSQNYTKDCKRVRVRMGSDSEWSSGRGYGAKKKTKKKNKTKQNKANTLQSRAGSHGESFRMVIGQGLWFKEKKSRRPKIPKKLSLTDEPVYKHTDGPVDMAICKSLS